MAFLRDDEIRRLLSFLKDKIRDAEKLAEIEDELKNEFGAEFLREPEILLYFPEQKIEIAFAETNWILRIIPYTSLRMTQRGIPHTANPNQPKRWENISATKLVGRLLFRSMSKRLNWTKIYS